MEFSRNIPVILLLFIISAFAQQFNANAQVHPDNNNVSSVGGRLSGIPTTTPQENVVHRPKSFPLTSSSSYSLTSEEHVGRTVPRGPAKSTFRNNVPAFIGNRGHGQKSSGLVLGQLMPKSVRFFGMQTVKNIVCYFARNGFWPRYPHRMGDPVQEMSRQIFEMDDDRVRIFCRPQINRPSVQGGPQPQQPGYCCRPVDGVLSPAQPSTVTPEYDYDTYTGTGTGTGSYTGEDTGAYYEYGRLQEPIKKETLDVVVMDRRGRTTTETGDSKARTSPSYLK